MVTVCGGVGFFRAEPFHCAPPGSLVRAGLMLWFLYTVVKKGNLYTPGNIIAYDFIKNDSEVSHFSDKALEKIGVPCV